MLELKIGNFEKQKNIKEFGNHWKFILVKEEDAIVLYIGALHIGEKFSHAKVASQNHATLQNVLGGGEMGYLFGTADIRGRSSVYNSVPNSVMEEFVKLIAEELETEYQIKKFEIDMWYDPETSEKRNPQHIEMWRELGYEFDNQKRVIEL